MSLGTALWCGAAAAALLLVPSPATGQVVTAGLRVDGGSIWLRRDAAAGAATWRGPALWGEGRVALGPLVVGADLLEARLEPMSSAAARRDLVDGAFFAGARVGPWLEVVAARRVRAYALAEGSQRWALWEVRGRAAGAVLAPTVWCYVELRRAFAASLDAVPAGTVQGGETGLVVRPESAVSFRLSYRIDEALLADGRSREVIEALGAGVAIAVP